MAQNDTTAKRKRLEAMGLTERDAREILAYSVSRSALKDIVGTYVPDEKWDGAEAFLSAMRATIEEHLIP